MVSFQTRFRFTVLVGMKIAYGIGMTVFAIYLLLLGWKTYIHIYYETDELPNPRPTQPKKNRLKVAFGPLFSDSK